MKNKKVLPALLGSVALTLGLVTVSTSINKEVVNAVEETITVSTNIADYADENGWTNGVMYTTVKMDDVVSVTATGGGSNTGKYYTSGENWRIYQTETPTVEISVIEGYQLSTVKITYASDKNGVLTYGGNNITSGTEVNDIEMTSISFGVGNTGSATNGQVRITQISVSYVKVVGDSPKDPKVELNELLTKYVVDGTYTKKTTINIDSDSIDLQKELAELGFENLFHAKATDLKRTTYYDGDALLMANYDGSLKNVGECTIGINSGYGTVNNRNLEEVKKVNKNAELGDMTHFKYNGETQVYDYIVKKGQNWIDDGMEGFYVTPKDFVVDNYFENWVKNSDNSYSLKNVDKDTQSDFINVVAPLLLEEMSLNYFTISELKVKENDGKLYLQIIADGEEGKLINGTNILAEAIITDSCDVDFSYKAQLDNVVFSFSEQTAKGTKLDNNSALPLFTDDLGEFSNVLKSVSVTNVYNGNGSGGAFAYTNGLLKFGTGSASGTLILEFDESVKFTSVKIKCHSWNNTSGDTISVNGSAAQKLPVTDTKTAELVFDIDASNVIQININNRGFIFEIFVD